MDFLLTVVSALPTVFYMWAGILLAWGAFCIYRFFSIKKTFKKNNQKIRKSDQYLCCLVLAFEVLLGSIVFGFPIFTYKAIEVVVAIAFWYTILLVYTQQITDAAINKKH